MTPTQLKQLLAIYEQGSLGRAAQRLRISEPALSKSLKALEDELGVPLMDRGPRGMSPTVFGEALAGHARVIREEFEQALRHIAELRGMGRGFVSVGAAPSFTASLLPAACARLLVRHPQIHVTVSEGLLDTLVPKLLRSEFDFLLVTLREEPLAPELAQTPLRIDPTAVLARANHPLAGRANLKLEDLLDSPWVLPRPPDRLRAWIDQRFVAAGLRTPTTAIDFGSVNFARAALMSADVLTFLPLELFADELSRGEVVVVRASGTRWDRTVGVTYRKRNSLTPAARALIQEIRAVCGKPSA
jgi:DNA-binding transcriptional LysR family regulator